MKCVSYIWFTHDTWMRHDECVMAHCWHCVSRAADIQRYAKHAWTPFCAAPTGQSVRTAGSRWRAAAWCRVMQSPMRTPSCGLFAHKHLLSGGAHICNWRGERRGNVATTAQRNAADAPHIGCCSVLQRIAECCSVLQCVAESYVAVCCREFRAVERKRRI